MTDRLLMLRDERDRRRHEHEALHDEQQDVDAGIRAAGAVGDDRLQRMAWGRVSPESFTHGSSAQRVEWFQRGLTSGDMAQCNTFAGR